MFWCSDFPVEVYWHVLVDHLSAHMCYLLSAARELVVTHSTIIDTMRKLWEDFT